VARVVVKFKVLKTIFRNIGEETQVWWLLEGLETVPMPISAAGVVPFSLGIN
jgi:hypothetical protein